MSINVSLPEIYYAMMWIGDLTWKKYFVRYHLNPYRWLKRITCSCTCSCTCRLNERDRLAEVFNARKQILYRK